MMPPWRYQSTRLATGEDQMSRSNHRPHTEPGPTTVATVWTIDAVRNLGLTTTVDTAASILGISRTKAYQLAKSGQFPVHLVRVGRRYLVPIPALLDLLRVGPTAG